MQNLIQQIKDISVNDSYQAVIEADYNEFHFDTADLSIITPLKRLAQKGGLRRLPFNRDYVGYIYCEPQEESGLTWFIIREVRYAPIM